MSLPGNERSHNKAETFSHSKSTWKLKADYPYHSGIDHNGLSVNGISHFKMLSIKKDFMIFGGFHYDNPVKDSRSYTELELTITCNPLIVSLLIS